VIRGANMAKNSKTNAMRIIEGFDIEYNYYTYDSKDGNIDGVSVAEKIGKNVDLVYKTLVAQGVSKDIYVYVIAVEDELDLKKAAKSVGEKKVEMIAVKDINKYTGYIRGGCSPIGMKKNYTTVVDSKAESKDNVVFSAGKVGSQVELTPQDLLKITKGKFENIVK